MTAISLAECRDISLSINSKEALYQQLYHEIRTRILDKRLINGQRLPASRELAKELNVSRNTVQLALTQLQAEGYLTSKTGSGVFVSAQIPDDYQQTIQIKADHTNKINRIPEPTLSNFAWNTLQSAGYEQLSYKAFTPGMPDLNAFPKNLWLKLWHKHLRNNPLSTIDNNSPSGLLSLKQVLCDYLRYSRAVDCKPDQIIITAGAGQALDLISRALINPGDAAIIEEPGYLGIRRLLQAVGAHLITCPVDEKGLKVSELPTHTKQAIKLLYTTPTHQYPLGGIMPISRRLELLEWAYLQNTYIIEDDYDSEFHYTSKPLPSLQSLDQQKRVLYVGSFSKVLTPFLRLGYLVIPKNLVSLFSKIKWLTSGATEPVKQSVVAEFIQAGHFGRHLKRMRLSYSQKMQWVVAEAEKQLSQWLHIGAHGAGMHLVVTFKNEFNDQKLLDRLKQQNLACKTLSNYYLCEPRKHGLILGFAHMQKNDILCGISTIRECIKESTAHKKCKR